ISRLPQPQPTRSDMHPGSVTFDDQMAASLRVGSPRHDYGRRGQRTLRRKFLPDPRRSLAAGCAKVELPLEIHAPVVSTSSGLMVGLRPLEASLAQLGHVILKMLHAPRQAIYARDHQHVAYP